MITSVQNSLRKEIIHFNSAQAPPGERAEPRGQRRGVQPAADLHGPGRGQGPGLPGKPQVRAQGRGLQELPGQLQPGGQAGGLRDDQAHLPERLLQVQQERWVAWIGVRFSCVIPFLAN